MKTIFKQPYTKEYDKFGKSKTFVTITVEDVINNAKVSLDYILEFYDEENLSLENTDNRHYREFVIPLIKQKINEEYSNIIKSLYDKLNNGQ